MSEKILKHQTPPSRMTDREKRELEEMINRSYVNGSATTVNIPIPLLTETGDYRRAHICMVIREQMLKNAENGKCIFRGHVWAKIGIHSFRSLTYHTMSDKAIRNALAALEETGYIRRRVLYDPDEKRYEESMYTLTDRAMILTDTNPNLAEYAWIHAEDTEMEAVEETPPDIEHGYTLIESLLFPFAPEDYKILSAEFTEDEKRDADAAMLCELNQRGYYDPKYYIN
jgi:DNA-binding HxlR family transcriptional regulator